jgi:hypothetical protein
MRQAQYARRIRAEFLRDPLDRRRLDNRAGASCGKQWTKITAACVKFHACGERIRRMELAGTDLEDIVRCALALYNLAQA